MDELEQWFATAAEWRRNNTGDESEYEQTLNDEEFAILALAIGDRQDLLKKCRWVVIQKMIKDGALVEVWPPMGVHREPSIRVAGQVEPAHQSTNRI